MLQNIAESCTRIIVYLLSFFKIGNKGLHYEILDPPTAKLFHYDDIIPIEILRIWHPSNKTVKS